MNEHVAILVKRMYLQWRDSGRKLSAANYLTIIELAKHSGRVGQVIYVIQP